MKIERMKKFGMLLMALMFLVGCKDDEEAGDGNVQLNVELKFDGDPYELFEEVINVTGFGQSIEQVSFYASNVQVVRSNGQIEDMSEIEFFDVGSGATTASYTLESGSYSGLRFAIGVPVPLNGTNDPDFEPTLYEPGHPLALSNNMYWNWEPGYRFMIYDGRVDTTPGAIDPDDFPVPYSIHMGKDTTYLPLEFDIPFTVAADGTTDLAIELDLAKCMHNEQDTLFLNDPDDNLFHGGNIPLAMRFRDLLSDAIQISVQ